VKWKNAKSVKMSKLENAEMVKCQSGRMSMWQIFVQEFSDALTKSMFPDKIKNIRQNRQNGRMKNE
jgi:hypothetical protein